MTNLNDMQESQICSAVGYQKAKLCVPVTITPFATPGKTVTTCCGRPYISAGNTCDGVVNGSCSFTISQDICVKVPVDLGATQTVGSVSVNCGTPSNQDICTNCGCSDTNVAASTDSGCSCQNT